MASNSGKNKGNIAGEVNRGALEALLGFQLRRAQIKLFQHFKTAMTDLAVTPGQAGVLILIETNPGISQAALARAMELERATLGETIDYLQDKHWVERRRSPSDGRSYALHLSVQGRKLMKKLHRAIHAHEQEVSCNLNAPECRVFLQLLRKFNQD